MMNKDLSTFNSDKDLSTTETILSMLIQEGSLSVNSLINTLGKYSEILLTDQHYNQPKKNISFIMKKNLQSIIRVTMMIVKKNHSVESSSHSLLVVSKDNNS